MHFFFVVIFDFIISIGFQYECHLFVMTNASGFKYTSILDFVDSVYDLLITFCSCYPRLYQKSQTVTSVHYNARFFRASFRHFNFRKIVTCSFCSNYDSNT